MLARYLTFTLAALAFVTSLVAETWVRGALTLHDVSGEVIISELGGDAAVIGPGVVPLSMPGLVNCEARHGDSVFFSASNRSYIFFGGEGSFAVERFEQVLPDPEVWQSGEREASQSRLILNLRAGHVVIDSRQMSDASQYLVETPLGRITVRRALWQMRIEFDPRSQIFDFTITCSDGRVRFTDLQGEQYTLRTGQRLSGAGARRAPSIEVGENTDRSREQMRRFLDLIAEHATAADELGAYQVHFQPSRQSAEVRSAAPDGLRDVPSARRPIVIEHAKEPPPVTPFRGEVRAPSAYQADLF